MLLEKFVILMKIIFHTSVYSSHCFKKLSSLYSWELINTLRFKSMVNNSGIGFGILYLKCTLPWIILKIIGCTGIKT